MSQIVDFYRGKGKDTEGRTLKQGWLLFEIPGQAEMCHDVVQWFYPLTEPSDFNPDAPLLTEDDIRIFKTNATIRTNLLHSVRLMLHFWGMAVNTDNPEATIRFTQHFLDKEKGWDAIFGSFNHNHLRMTRILLCLTLVGQQKLAKAIYKFMQKEDQKLNPEPPIPGSCWQHWAAALEGKSIPRPPKMKLSASWFQGANRPVEVGKVESGQTILNTYWESAKADYEEILEMLKDGAPDWDVDEKKVAWFNAWAKKMLQMSQ